jgi:hypothetical protein
MILRDLPKHNKYQNSYKRFDIYWGLGVEHETYIKTSQTKTFTTFEGNMKPERYSVSYYKSYKDEKKLKEVLEKIIEVQENKKLIVPVLINSHSFTHADKYGIHKTTYEKIPKLNPQFEGETFFEWCCKNSTWLKENYEKGFMWDGDSIEFINEKFYKVTVKDVLEEINSNRNKFIEELNKLPKQGLLIAYNPLELASPINEPFATHHTNPKNITMFNNGTIHINITLPTRLGFWNPKKPSNWKTFEEQHRKFARMIQWLEPFWISVYGSGDPLASVDPSFSPASQRLAVSRYIGLGTFDTNSMPKGKILQVKRNTLGSLPWYDEFYKQTEYQNLEDIGLDINFYKHGAHGLELRFFDQMSNEHLEKVLEEIIQVADWSLVYPLTQDPRTNKTWHKIATKSLLEGKGYVVSLEEIETVCKNIFINDSPKSSLMVQDALEWILQRLPKHGFCWEKMIGKQKSKKYFCF